MAKTVTMKKMQERRKEGRRGQDDKRKKTLALRSSCIQRLGGAANKLFFFANLFRKIAVGQNRQKYSSRYFPAFFTYDGIMTITRIFFSCGAFFFGGGGSGDVSQFFIRGSLQEEVHERKEGRNEGAEKNFFFSLSLHPQLMHDLTREIPCFF